MHSNTEAVISSDGVTWKATLPDGEVVTAGELTELDNKLRESCRRVFLTSEGDTVTAYYRFDHSVMPEWMRQYSDHYFNRIVEFKY